MMTVKELKNLLYALKDDTVIEVVAEGDMACICEGFEGRKIKGLFMTNAIKENAHGLGTAFDERGFLLLESAEDDFEEDEIDEEDGSIGGFYEG